MNRPPDSAYSVIAVIAVEAGVRAGICIMASVDILTAASAATVAVGAAFARVRARGALEGEAGGAIRADVDEHAPRRPVGGAAFPGTPGPAEVPAVRERGGGLRSAGGPGRRGQKGPEAGGKGEEDGEGAVHRGQASLSRCDLDAEREHGGAAGLTVGVPVRGCS